MNSDSNIILGDELQQKLISGISKVTEVIRKNYGPKGSNVSIEQYLYPFHIIANDAQSIIQSVYFNDPTERRALNFLKELTDKNSKTSGEGRKTSLIIAEELLKGGFEQNTVR